MKSLTKYVALTLPVIQYVEFIVSITPQIIIYYKMHSLPNIVQ